MVIRKFNSAELKEFIYSEEYKTLKAIPITRHRALSHIRNPRVAPSDTILYLAMEGKDLVGYRIVMADKIFLKEQEHKVGWYSCVWVDPEKRGRGIAKELVNESMKDWENRIVLGDPVPESKSLYLQTGKFTDKVKSSGLRGYLQFSLSEILLKKAPRLHIIKPLLRSLDFILNIPNSIRIALWETTFRFDLPEMEYVTEIDQETERFIQLHNKNDLSQRNKAELDWLIKNPWVIMSPLKDPFMEKFHFSSQAKQFFNLSIKIFENGKLSAFLIFYIRDGHLKIPFLSLGEDADIKKILRVIYFHLLKYKLSTFTTFNPKLSEYIRNHRHPFIITKRISKQYLFSKLYENQLLTNNMYIQDGEGDTAFT